MNIEYLSGIKPGAKIDLGRSEKKDSRPETYLPELKESLRRLAAEVEADIPGFLDEDGRIRLDGADAAKDQKLVASQEDAFRGHKDRETWRRDSEKNPANLAEIALTLAIHKRLGPDFIVARSSVYDDYNNGVDQVLIYKPTGEVLCGFDEVIGNEGDDGGCKKEAKLERIMARGGAHIKYGAKLEDGKLVRASLHNIPAFYVSLSKKELSELLASLKSNKDICGSDERRIFSKLLGSLENQAAKQNLTPELMDKTDSMLDRLRKAEAI